MGGTRSTATDWSAYSQSAKTQSQTYHQAFTNRSGAKAQYDPKSIKVRESVASDVNPHPTPIILAMDATGSMQDISLSVIKNIGTLMSEIYTRQPVSDPHILAMFFDDVRVTSDGVLQATQFEADKIIIDQLGELFFTGNGGGNGFESYNLPLHFALTRCVCDAFKDGRKGFIFTIGDDGPPPPLTTADVRTVYGPDEPEIEPTAYADLLAQAEENWHVFHILPMEGNRQNDSRVINAWRQVLGERAITLSDVNKLAEVLVATMQVIAGADAATVAASFSDPGTALVVQSAIGGLVAAKGAQGGVTRLQDA